MALEVALPMSTNADQPTYNCPNCGAGLYSPYHTVCPVCAEPIDPETIQQALGKEIDVAKGGGGADRQTIAIGVGVGVVVAIILLAILL